MAGAKTRAARGTNLFGGPLGVANAANTRLARRARAAIRNR